jgi:hypothetical protein
MKLNITYVFIGSSSSLALHANRIFGKKKESDGMKILG